MPDTCLVTFTARDSSFAVLPGQTITFVPTGALVAGQATNLLARTTRSVVADGAGAGSIALVPGTYRLETMGSDGLIVAPVSVPDVTSATIGDCLEALPASAATQLQVALLAASSGRMFETPAQGYASAAVAVGEVFLALAAGVVSVYRKTSPVAGVLLGPLFAYADGLVVNGAVTGLGVTQSQVDWTSGRLMKVADFGLGAQIVAQVTDLTLEIRPGFYWFLGSTVVGGPPDTTVFQWQLLVTKGSAGVAGNNFLAFKMGGSGAANRMFWGSRIAAGGPIIWSEIRGSQNLLGPVSQSGGIPTGAIIERGSNANGEFVRFADGLQECTNTGLVAPIVNTATGSLFRSTPFNWTFPAAFAVAPVVTGDVDDATSWLVTHAAPTTTVASLNVHAAQNRPANLIARARAVGRWF